MTVQKAYVLSSPSTSTRGAAHISCDSPSQPHGPAGCIWGRQAGPSALQCSIAHNQCSQCPPAPPTPIAQHPTARCCAFSLGLRSLPARRACSPPRAKNNRANCNLPGSFLNTRAEQSINHSRRPFRLPPSFSHQVVKPSSARPSACTTTCSAYDHDEDDGIHLGPR